MSIHKKAYKASAFRRFPHILLPEYYEKAKWEHLFPVSQPLALDLGCGKGEFTLIAAMRKPHLNWIGIELRSPRLWFAGKLALHLNILNVRFLQGDINQLPAIFPPDLFQEIWINFPEPHPKKKRAKNRFTHLRYLNMYATLLKPGGTLHVKTDHPKLFEWTLKQLQESTFVVKKINRNLYQNEEENTLARVITCYEKNFLAEGRVIHYCVAECRK